MTNFSFNLRGKKVLIDVKICNRFEKFFGLMFSRREKAENLLFEFSKPTKIKIHSMFVFFPFVAVWLDEKNNVLSFDIVRPFTFSVSPPEKFSRLLEIPVKKENKGVIDLFVFSRRRMERFK